MSADDPNPVEIGNVLVIDANHGAASVGSRGGPEVRVRWDSDSLLSVEHDRRVRVFKAENRVLGVPITYDTFQ